MNTVVYQQTSTLMTIFQHSLNNWKRFPWLRISTISWWEWNWRKPNGTDVREYSWSLVVKMMSFITCVSSYVWSYDCVMVWRWWCTGLWFTTHFWSGKSRRSGVVKLLEKFKKRIYKNHLRQVRRLSGLFRRMIFVGSSYKDILFLNFSSNVTMWVVGRHVTWKIQKRTYKNQLRHTGKTSIRII